jgi:hypothetical protein
MHGDSGKDAAMWQSYMVFSRSFRPAELTSENACRIGLHISVNAKLTGEFDTIHSFYVAHM